MNRIITIFTFLLFINAFALANSKDVSQTKSTSKGEIVWNPPRVMSWGDPDYTALASGGDIISVKYESSNPKVATYINGVIHIVGIGTTNLIFRKNGQTTGTYSTLRVSKGSISVRTKDYYKLQGAEMPKLEYYVDGYNGEDESYITGNVSISCDAKKDSPCGKYKITLGGASLKDGAHYNLRYSAGKVIIYTNPVTNTKPAIKIKSTTATLMAEVKDAEQIFSTDYNFEYGETTNYGSSKYASWVSENERKLDLEDLKPNTIYHYRVVASAYIDGKERFFYGSDNSFKTGKDSQTIEFAQLPQLTYGDDDIELSKTSSAGLPVIYTSTDENVAKIVDGKLKIVGAGNCYVHANCAGNDEYFDAREIQKWLNIERAPLTVEVDSHEKWKFTPNPELTYKITGYVNNEDETVFNGTFRLNANVGLYTIAGLYEISALYHTPKNYIVEVKKGKFKVKNPITLKNISSSDIGTNSANITGSISDVNLDVTYGVQTSLSYNFPDDNSNFHEFEIATVGKDKEFTMKVDNLTPNRRWYFRIFAKKELPNGKTYYWYSQRYKYFSTPRPKDTEEISMAEITPKTYGDATFQLYATVYSGREITYTSSDENIATIKGNTVTIVNSGTCNITATCQESSTYTKSEITRELVVNKATLTVSANDKSKWYKLENPVCDYTIDGFVNGDTSSDLTNWPFAFSESELMSPPGYYLIYVFGGEAKNYNFKYYTAYLTVSSPVSIKDTKATDIRKTSAVLSANLSNVNLDFNYGFQISETEEFNEYINVGSTTIGEDKEFNKEVSGLKLVTKYYFRAYTESNGTYWYGETSSFTTFDSRTPQVILFNEISEKTYGDEAFDLNASVDSNKDIIYTSSDENIATISGNKVTILNSGSIYITASCPGDENFLDATDVIRELVVNKATLTITADGKERWTKFMDPPLTYTLSGLVNGDTEDVLTTKPILYCSAAPMSSSGSYLISPQGGEARNYNIKHVSARMILKRPITFTIPTASDISKTSVKLNSKLTNVNLDFNYGFQISETEDFNEYINVGSISIGEEIEYSKEITGLKKETKYYFRGYVESNGIYWYVATRTFNTLGDKTPQVITFNELDAKTYGDVAFELNASVDTDREITYTSSDENIATISGNTVTIINSGTCNITATCNGDETYADANEVRELVVNKATLTLEATSRYKTYKLGDPILTYTIKGLVNNDTEDVLTKPNIYCDAEKMSPPGSYPITFQGGYAKNYNITFKIGYIIIEDALEIQNLMSTNITNSSAVISAKLIYINTSLNYGIQISETEDFDEYIKIGSAYFAEVKNFSKEVTGLQPETKYYFRVYAEKQGTYWYGNNKSFVTIKNKTEQTISFAELESKTYGDASFDLTASVNSNREIVYTSSDEKIATVSGNTVTIVNSGTCNITAASKGNEAYTDAEVVRELVINKADLTITAENKERWTNVSNPELTYVCSGFVNNDTEAEFTNSVAITCDANNNSDEGEYPITVSDAEANNYNISFINGNLSIKKPVSISTGLAENITESAAELNAELRDVKIDFEYGFQISESEDFNADILVSQITSGEDKNYKTTASGLNAETKYFYRAYVKAEINNTPTYWYGTIKSFNTPQEQITDISEMEDVSIKLYPNPATNYFIVKSSDKYLKSISIYNLSGKQILNKECNDSKQRINIENLPAGNYFVVINFTNSNNSITQKLIVK